MSVTSRVVKLHLRKLTSSSQMITGGDRRQYLDAVWDMYKSSYASIGLSVSSPQGLMKYDVWELFFNQAGEPIAFNLYKKTRFGLKTGLLGSNGETDGKQVIKHHIKARYRRPGVYGEVSHAVERLSQGAAVVCAVHVPEVLGKPVTPEEDGVHYTRTLSGVGKVTKKMVGSPKGVPSGPEGSCPTPSEAEVGMRMAFEEDDDELSLADHYSSQLDFE